MYDNRETEWSQLLEDAIDWLPAPIHQEILTLDRSSDWLDPIESSAFLKIILSIKEADLDMALDLIEQTYETTRFPAALFLLRARVHFLRGEYDQLTVCLKAASEFDEDKEQLVATTRELHALLQKVVGVSHPEDIGEPVSQVGRGTEVVDEYPLEAIAQQNETSDKGSCSTLSDNFQSIDLRHDANVSSINASSDLCTIEIPRKLHFVWVGDPDRCPNNLIDTWRDKNPSCSVTVWGNLELFEHNWITKALMHNLFDQGIYCGVADLMRYEILLNEGGVAIDADSECLRTLPEFIFQSEVFAAWESEIARPGLIANGTMGAVARSKFLIHIIDEIINEKNIEGKQAWQVFGPGRITQTYRKFQYHKLVIHPSYYFTPEHFTGVRYDGNGESYARQFWATTRGAS